MHVLWAIHRLLWPFGLKADFVKGETPLRPTFAPPWIHSLEYLTKTTTRMVAFQVMPMSHAKYSDEWLPKYCDYRTDTQTDRDWQTLDKVIHMCRYALQATQKNNKKKQNAATISEIGYLLHPSRDMAERSLKRRKSSKQPTNQKQNGCIQSKAFRSEEDVLWSPLWLIFALSWIHPGQIWWKA